MFLVCVQWLLLDPSSSHPVLDSHKHLSLISRHTTALSRCTLPATGSEALPWGSSFFMDSQGLLPSWEMSRCILSAPCSLSLPWGSATTSLCVFSVSPVRAVCCWIPHLWQSLNPIEVTLSFSPTLTYSTSFPINIKESFGLTSPLTLLYIWSTHATRSTIFLASDYTWPSSRLHSGTPAQFPMLFS